MSYVSGRSTSLSRRGMEGSRRSAIYHGLLQAQQARGGRPALAVILATRMSIFTRTRHECARRVSGAEAVAVDRELADLVADDALGGVQELRGLRTIAASRLEGVLDQRFFVGGHRVGERQIAHRAGRLGRLQGRRQVMR